MLLHLTQPERHIERACERHGLVLLPDTLRCPRGHQCFRWLVVLVVDGHVYPFPSAPFDAGLSVLAGRTPDGFASWRAARTRSAQARARDVKRSLPTCRRGHAWDVANTLQRTDSKGRTARTCRTCRNRSSRDNIRLRRAALRATA